MLEGLLNDIFQTKISFRSRRRAAPPWYNHYTLDILYTWPVRNWHITPARRPRAGFRKFSRKMFIHRARAARACLQGPQSNQRLGHSVITMHGFWLLHEKLQWNIYYVLEYFESTVVVNFSFSLFFSERQNFWLSVPRYILYTSVQYMESWWWAYY